MQPLLISTSFSSDRFKVTSRDYRDPQIVSITQDVVEQRAFTSTQKSRQYGYGKAVGHRYILIGRPLR
jgi:anti-sigma regulatory factor (Ser/Thr protein kinase)